MVNKAVTAVLEGLFPAYCMLCGLRSDNAQPLCLACRDDMQLNICCCWCCAIPLSTLDAPPDAPLQERLCGHCLRQSPPYRRVIAPWLYCERLAQLIHQWKYQGERRLTPLLASLWLQHAVCLPVVDVLVPVPLHWRRLWLRGFNQAQLLCSELRAAQPGLADANLASRAVRRRRATPAQSSMNASQRAVNLRDAFTVSGRYDNLRVAIVDDVLTTGATAASLASVLLDAGASHVDVWCLARTPAPRA